MLRKKILFVILIVFLGGNFVFAFTFLSNDKENINQTAFEVANQLLSQVTYDEETDFFHLGKLLSYGEEELVLKICSRIKKLSTNKTLLRKINCYENVAFIRLLVKNETITSINQLPIVSMNAYSELPIKELVQVGYIEDKKYFFWTNASVFDEPDKTKIETIEIDPKEYYKNHVKFLELMTTYILMEKYPAMSIKLIQDYTTKNGLNINLLQILIDNGEYNNAITLGNQFINEPFVKDLLAVVYAKLGDFEKALELSDEIIKSQKDRDYDKKISAYARMAHLYKYAKNLKENKYRILDIENEIIITAKESNHINTHGFEKGDLICFLNQFSDTFKDELGETIILGRYDVYYINFSIGFLENIQDIRPYFSFQRINTNKKIARESWDWEKF